jgi:CRISPR system Cascade subunit CasA
LHAITLKRSAAGVGGPACLNNVLGEQEFDLWVGAFVANQAKVLDGLEAVFHVPHGMLEDSGRQRYEQGAGFAGGLARRLGQAVRAYRHATERTAFDAQQRAKAETQIRRNKGEKERLQALELQAVLRYWTAAEHWAPMLLHLVTFPPPISGGRYQFASTDWGKRLFQAALAAYDLACPHETPRQVKAYVLGRALLLRPEATSDTEPETEDTE